MPMNASGTPKSVVLPLFATALQETKALTVHSDWSDASTDSR